MSHHSYIFTKIENGIGYLGLNRPSALNSLNVEMVEVILMKLQEWKEDNNVALIYIYGEGEKGLCAGGDMRTFYDLKESNSDVKSYAEKFFSTEYKMNYEIHHYPKPIIAYMDGIVMGGGVGIAIGASHRIVTEKTKWAMPEMNIGFFPDVGASYFLNRMQGYVGRYIALTSEVLKAEDVIYIGAADNYIERDKWPIFISAMEQKKWELDSARKDLDYLLQRYCQSSSLSQSSLEAHQEKIDIHFSYQTLEDIVLSLQTQGSKGDSWAEQTAQTIKSKSPTALKVTLRQLQEGEHKQLHECLDMEMSLAKNFMNCHDFYEGVRSVLVDKDRSPKWVPGQLENVSEAQVDLFFQKAGNLMLS